MCYNVISDGDNMDRFLNLRSKYPTFIYHDYKIEEIDNVIKLVFYFEIVGLKEFFPVIEIPKCKEFNINQDLFNYLVFHVGMMELVSYWKSTCSPNIIIDAGYLNQEQLDWFKKVYYLGLGEFRYLNHIDTKMDDFLHFTCTKEYKDVYIPEYIGHGNLIPVGGGKDSNVTMELLKKMDNHVFIINPKAVTLECTKLAGLENKVIGIKRVIDENLIELNKEGYLNGHTPFSGMLAFISYLVGFMYNKKYIVLSNEASANEATVIGTDINHQYSKSYQFESDFDNYTKKYFKIDLQYFSFLRPLNELEIAMLFSKYKKYHHVFKSCNQGSKKEPWHWCGSCPKCLFVYIILSPFLKRDELIEIFGCDLYQKEELLETFLELLGFRETKPFECVGTKDEVRFAVSKALEKEKDLPFLLKYYKEHYPKITKNYLEEFNLDNNVPEEFLTILKEELKNARENY